MEGSCYLGRPCGRSHTLFDFEQMIELLASCNKQSFVISYTYGPRRGNQPNWSMKIKNPDWGSEGFGQGRELCAFHQDIHSAFYELKTQALAASTSPALDGTRAAVCSINIERLGQWLIVGCT
jgi:hypothetical protein